MSTKKVKATSDTRNSSVDVETPDVLVEQTPAILSLPPKMQRFIHLYSTGQYTLNKLAQLLEIHPNTAGLWLRRSDVKEIIADMQESTHEVVTHQLKVMTAKAADKLSALVDSPIDGVALAAVKDILDRAGHKPKQEIKIDKTVVTMEQKMQELVDRTIIDVEADVE